MKKFFFGRLTFDALPHHWYTVGATIVIFISLIIIAIYLTKTRKWGWLWKEWFTSTDPKQIGVMYMIAAFVMLFRALVDAGMLWLQQAIASDNTGYLTSSHFQEIFTAHGDIMVFFVVMGFFFGFMNWIVPLQIGTRDLAFPFMNSLGFWLYVAGAILINLFFVIGGHFANTGWLATTPLSEIEFNPGVGVDYLIWSLQLSGLGSLLSGINFMVTIIKKRAPGMTLMRMPLFVWTTLFSTILIVTAFPALTATLFLLWLDRFFDMHIFTSSYGGNQMLYFNFVWMWGHPEVYILVIPSWGMFSEIVATFSQRKVFGYTSLVLAAGFVTLLSYLVWLHHFFTMGSDADVNSFFGIVTQLIAIPTGVQIFNWLITLFKGKVHFATPLYWFIGFVVIFTIGGMAGLILATPPADYQVHNSLFLIAHFHTMAIGAGLFGIFAGITYWIPKITGVILDERLGKRAFWLWFTGFFLSFIPLYLLGFMGAARRLDHYPSETGWQPLFIVSAVGFMVIIAGLLTQVQQLYVSFKNKKKHLDKTGDPWNGRTLEWSLPSPPPFYSFPAIPKVTGRDTFWQMKKEGKFPKKYEDIEMPNHTGMGVYISAFGLISGFGLVWYIHWMTIAGIIGVIVCLIVRSLDRHTERIIPAEKVKKIEAFYGR